MSNIFNSKNNNTRTYYYKDNKQKFLTFWNKSKGYITSIVNVAIGIWATDKTFALEIYNGCFIIIDTILNKFLSNN